MSTRSQRNELVEIWDRPDDPAQYMIAGWRQWADAGSISSALPQMLIDRVGGVKIGRIKPDDFYLFQVPGTHHLLRPKVTLEEGYRKELEERKNELFFAQGRHKGFYIFLGEEPHMGEERYADAFLDAAKDLGVERIAVIGGVQGPVPYDRDRQVSCVYSHQEMKEELTRYAVKFSNYEGGPSIGTYVAHRAGQRSIELFVLYALVPAYDFRQQSVRVTGVKIDQDYKAWYDLMRRLNHMFDLGLDLSTLARQSEQLTLVVKAQLEELDRKLPELDVHKYIEQIGREFEETSFMPLSDVWERELEDLLDD